MREPACSQAPLAPVQVAASTAAAVALLRERFPNTPFLTLGQTVLWDEPVKAAFCRVLETMVQAGTVAPGARIVAGVHDTDYFAKLPALAIRDVPFVMLRHNDGDTRGLWSAAGEISALFGAEIVPSRSQLAADGVAFALAAQAYPGGVEALLNQETEAPLWRALVHTEPHPLLAAEVRCRDIAPVLLEQLRWAFRHSLRAMGCDGDLLSDSPCASRDVARTILAWAEEFTTLAPEATLSELYRNLLPRIWALVSGGHACSLETTASMDLFRFNPTTAALPRFRFLDLFLNPATREGAQRAYDAAVRGSGIYTLKGFGEGALPFDVVIPGRGRGTLRLLDGAVSIETEEPIQICDNCDPESVAQLAAILHHQLGPDIALVGKAVTLISMLAAEFVIVFHEQASSYTKRTQKLNAALRRLGAALPLHPILRLQHSAWDALDGVPAEFNLPPHLARGFGVRSISASAFAARWKEVAAQHDLFRQELAAARSPAALLELLARHDSAWQPQEAEFAQARHLLAGLRTRVQPLAAGVLEARAQARALSLRARELEAQRGDRFRATVAPLRQQLAALLAAAANSGPQPAGGAERAPLSRTQRQALAETREADIRTLEAAVAQHSLERDVSAAAIAALRTQARALRQRARELLAAQLALERGPQAQEARATLRRVAAEAELTRLRAVRDAMVLAQGLRYTNHRPTAWWLPLVSPDGTWFRNLAARMEARLEEL